LDPFIHNRSFVPTLDGYNLLSCCPRYVVLEYVTESEPHSNYSLGCVHQFLKGSKTIQ